MEFQELLTALIIVGVAYIIYKIIMKKIDKWGAN